jgi:endonuclease YncB( thermonuclease family)
MRPALSLGAVLSFIAIGLGISAVGRHLAGGDASPIAIEPNMPATAPMAAKSERARQPGSDPPAKAVVSAPPPKDGSGYARVKPRAPLGDLGLAQPPPQKASNDWDGTNLFRPVANAAGVFESMGYTVTVAGTDIIDPEEKCVYQGKSWPCGALARTAFRSFLHGRAVTCALPPEGKQKSIAADCRVGKENVGEWLVSNGWARAAGNGPYGDAGKKAQSDGKGIFGPPPSLE